MGSANAEARNPLLAQAQESLLAQAARRTRDAEEQLREKRNELQARACARGLSGAVVDRRLSNGAQTAGAAREALGVELYGVQQQLQWLLAQLSGAEEERSAACDSRASAEAALAEATQAHHALAQETEAARSTVRPRGPLQQRVSGWQHSP